jgi:poly-gamma-glutamate capsule biosynthesis protein CapA/YwtB (metallophosphatase superfamily)
MRAAYHNVAVMKRWCVPLCLLLAGASRGGLATVHAEPREAAPARVITLGFVGDLMMHSLNRAVADYRDLYRGVEELLRGDDLTFANLEFPVDPGRPYADYPRFNGTAAYLQAAVEAGIDVFSLANNHAFDGAEEGVLQTLRSLDRAGRASGRPVRWAGARANPASPFAAARAEVGGVRVAFLAATEFLNLRGSRGRIAVVDYRDRRQADEFAALVSTVSASCDVLVVSYHGGVEYSSGPGPGLDAFLGRLAACGAVVVFGHHPHVLHAPRFVYAGPSCRLVLPSMGNFLSGQAQYLDPRSGRGAVAPGTGDSALVRVRLACGRGWATVIGVEAVPLAVHWNGRGEMVVGRLSALAGSAPDRSARAVSAWEAYYRGRLDGITDLLEGIVTSSGPAASPPR